MEKKKESCTEEQKVLINPVGITEDARGANETGNTNSGTGIRKGMTKMIFTRNPQYDEYLERHRQHVSNALEWMKKHGIIEEAELTYQDISDIAGGHDFSKYSEEEYNAYADYFYGKEGKDEDDISVIDSAFDYAWLHHLRMNPHHWQYWVLVNDDDGIKALEIPRKYVYEMIADWWSFSWEKGNLKEIFAWYDEHKSRNKIILHEKTGKLVEDILEKMKKILDKDPARTENIPYNEEKTNSGV